MPEGPEVWILSEAINCFYKNDNTFAYGKHLFLRNEQQDWSFGLGGKVRINNETGVLEKRTDGYVTGNVNEYNGLIVGLGTNWLTASLDELKKSIEFILQKHGRKKLGVVLLDQKIIAGIGVAWGSEICFRAQVRPDLSVQEQDLSLLAEAMVFKRNEIKNVYLTSLQRCEDVKEFINNWFENLYRIRIRNMLVYFSTAKVKVNGRNWWIYVHVAEETI